MRIGTVKDRLKATLAKLPAGPDPVYQCPKCKDTGLVLFTDKNGYERCCLCECEIRRKHERICKNAGFELAGAKTLDEYRCWNETAKIAKTTAQEYIRDFDAVRRSGKNWFLVFGQTGSGKTTLGRAIVKALIERPKPVPARAVKYYEMMQRLKSKSNDTDYWDLLRVYTNCALLFIDDLLKEKVQYGDLTEADTKHLFAVLDSRYESRLPTIITSECTSGRLDALDEAMYGRMRERAYAEIIFDSKDSNYRKRA